MRGVHGNRRELEKSSLERDLGGLDLRLKIGLKHKHNSK